MSNLKLLEHQKQWEHYTKEELVRIAKMLGNNAYGDIVLNMNDVFGFACAWGIELDQWDLLAVTELYEKYGDSGVVALCSVKEDTGDPIGKSDRYPNFNEAKKHILENPLYYSWIKKIREKNEDT